MRPLMTAPRQPARSEPDSRLMPEGDFSAGHRTAADGKPAIPVDGRESDFAGWGSAPDGRTASSAVPLTDQSHDPFALQPGAAIQAPMAGVKSIVNVTIAHASSQNKFRRKNDDARPSDRPASTGHRHGGRAHQLPI